MGDDRDNDDRYLKLVQLESFRDAMDFLDEEIRKSGNTNCEKMLIDTSNDSDYSNVIMFVVVDYDTCQPVNNTKGVVVLSSLLSDEDKKQMRRMNILGHKDERGREEEPPESPITMEEEIELLFEESPFIHTEKPPKKGRRRKKDCD